MLAWFIGILPPFTVNADGFPLNILGPGGIVNIVVVLVGATMTIFIGFIQLMMLGEGSTMNPRKFALYGIADRNLQFGLLLSGLSGIPSLTGVASLMLWTLAYRHMGPAVIISSLLAAVLAVITMMSISKLVIALSTTLVTSKRGKGAFYIFIVLTFVIICQLPNILVNSGIAFSLNTETWGAATAIAAWTPFGAAFQLPFDALTGAWAVLIARIAILAVTWIVCFAVCTWCLRHERLTIGANSPSETAKGIGAFAWMPDSASGAVSARLITYLKRDPRQAMTFAMPVLFLIIFAFQAHGISAVVWQSLIWCGWFMSVVESNGLAYDGRGFTMEVIAGVRGRTDRIGRVRVYVGIMVVYMVLLYLAGIVLVGALTGRWAQPDDLAHRPDLPRRGHGRRLERPGRGRSHVLCADVPGRLNGQAVLRASRPRHGPRLLPVRLRAWQPAADAAHRHRGAGHAADGSRRRHMAGDYSGRTGQRHRHPGTRDMAGR